MSDLPVNAWAFPPGDPRRKDARPISKRRKVVKVEEPPRPGSAEEVRHLQKYIAKLERALNYYADYGHYMLPERPTFSDRKGAVYVRSILDDGGRRARVALGEEEVVDE